MPWIKYYGFGGSPFDLLFELSGNLKNLDKAPSILLSYLLLIFPICGIAILVFYLQPTIKNDSIFILESLKKAPLILLLAIIIYGLVKMGDSSKYLADANILEVLGAGLYLTIISSLVLFFHPFNPGNLEEKNVDQIKEKVNNDDLFK
jgi:hypothetical protein